MLHSFFIHVMRKYGPALFTDLVMRSLIELVILDTDDSKSRFRTLVAEYLPDDSAVERVWYTLWDIFYEDVAQQIQEAAESREISANEWNPDWDQSSPTVDESGKASGREFIHDRTALKS